MKSSHLSLAATALGVCSFARSPTRGGCYPLRADSRRAQPRFGLQRWAPTGYPQGGMIGFSQARKAIVLPLRAREWKRGAPITFPMPVHEHDLPRGPSRAVLSEIPRIGRCLTDRA